MRQKMMALALVGLFGSLTFTSDASACCGKKMRGGGHRGFALFKGMGCHKKTVCVSGPAPCPPPAPCGPAPCGPVYGHPMGYAAPAPMGYPSGQMAQPSGQAGY